MTYRIDLSEAAEAEAFAAYLWISRRSPEFAGRWYNGLLKAIEDLVLFPRSWQAAPEYGPNVRRMLYGTGGNRYRLLYLIIEPEEGQEEGIIRILHVYHGARQIGGRGNGDDERNEP